MLKMRESVWILFSTLVCATVVMADVEEVSEKHVEHLLKIEANREPIRSYLDIPPADSFIAYEVAYKTPIKLVNYSDYYKNLFDAWDRKKFNQQFLLTSLVFGNETITDDDGKSTTSKTNLRRFLNDFDSSKQKLKGEFRVPSFVRKAVIVPGVLNCEFMKDKLTDLKFEFYANYDKFTSGKKLDDDRLICLLDGQTTVFLIEQTDSDKIFDDSIASNRKNFMMFDLKSGECAYVPHSITPFYKTEKMWLLMTTWKNGNYTLMPENCTGSPDIDTSKMPKFKLSEFEFASDSVQKQINRKSSAIKYFINYFHKDPSMTEEEFLNLVKKDKKLMTKIPKCEKECSKNIKKIFAELDFNQDESFEIIDLEYLDHDKALHLNFNIEKALRNMKKRDSDIPNFTEADLLPLIEKFKVFGQHAIELRDLADEMGVLRKLNFLFKSKLPDLKFFLTDEQFRLLNNVDLTDLAGSWKTIMRSLGLQHFMQMAADMAPKSPKAQPKPSTNPKKEEEPKQDESIFDDLADEIESKEEEKVHKEAAKEPDWNSQPRDWDSHFGPGGDSEMDAEEIFAELERQMEKDKQKDREDL